MRTFYCVTSVSKIDGNGATLASLNKTCRSDFQPPKRSYLRGDFFYLEEWFYNEAEAKSHANEINKFIKERTK